MGHSVGLRHNFVSSSAPLFYRPQYWQLRTANGAQKTACTDAVADGSTCTGPRYWDPMTEEEQSQMIWMFMQSTVMDYPGEVSQDMIGLGAYDFAAARFFYSDVTSIYNVHKNGKLDPSYLSNAPIGEGMINTTDNFGGLVGIKYTLGAGNAAVNMHYSALQQNFNLISNCQTVTPAAPRGGAPRSTACGIRSSTARSCRSGASPPGAARSRSTTRAGTSSACPRPPRPEARC